MISVKMDEDRRLIMAMDDEELEKFRAWMKHLVIREPTKIEILRDRVREWRKKNWPPPTRKNSKAEIGKVHIRCGTLITDSNSYIGQRGRLFCRKCDILKARKYLVKQMTRNLYKALQKEKEEILK